MRLGLLLVLTSFLAAACDSLDAPPRPTAAVTAATDVKSQNEATAAEAGTAWTPLGLQVKEVPKAALKALGVAYGVMVTKVRAPADRSRILPGDVIVGVNQTRIGSVEEFNKFIAGQGPGPIGLLVRRADADLYIALELGNNAAVGNPGSDPENASRGGSAAPPRESFKARRPAPTDKPLRT